MDFSPIKAINSVSSGSAPHRSLNKQNKIQCALNRLPAKLGNSTTGSFQQDRFFYRN